MRSANPIRIHSPRRGLRARGRAPAPATLRLPAPRKASGGPSRDRRRGDANRVSQSVLADPACRRLRSRFSVAGAITASSRVNLTVVPAVVGVDVERVAHLLDDLQAAPLVVERRPPCARRRRRPRLEPVAVERRLRCRSRPPPAPYAWTATLPIASPTASSTASRSLVRHLTRDEPVPRRARARCAGARARPGTSSWSSGVRR